MKRSKLALLVPFLFLASAFTYLHAQTATEPERQVSALVQRFTNAQIAYNIPTLTDCTADNYIEVSPIGDVDSRTKMLASYASEPIPGLTVHVTEPQVRLFGPADNPDTAIVIEKLTYLLPGPNDTTRTIDLRTTFVARKTPVGWKLISSQASAVRPTPPAATPTPTKPAPPGK